jgi:hypothetical protein
MARARSTLSSWIGKSVKKGSRQRPRAKRQEPRGKPTRDVLPSSAVLQTADQCIQHSIYLLGAFGRSVECYCLDELQVSRDHEMSLQLEQRTARHAEKLDVSRGSCSFPSLRQYWLESRLLRDALGS